MCTRCRPSHHRPSPRSPSTTQVNTVDEARLAVAAAKYPPEGNRSVGGGSHFLNFDCSPGAYYLHANDRVLVVLQTESPEGVENAPAIYAVPGVDAIFVGACVCVEGQAMPREPHRTR